MLRDLGLDVKIVEPEEPTASGGDADEGAAPPPEEAAADGAAVDEGGNVEAVEVAAEAGAE